MPEHTLAIVDAIALSHGVSAKPPVREPLEVLREIDSRDVPLLVQELREHNWGKAHAATQPQSMVQVLRTGHHQLAQLLASGVEVEMASFITGRSAGSIHSLKSDPAFQELLAYYAHQQELRDIDAIGRLVTLGATAIEVLQQRIEESPEKFTNNELRQLLESTMDRSVAPAKGGPRSLGGGQGLNVSINFVKGGAQVVEQLASAPAVVIEHQAEEKKE